MNNTAVQYRNALTGSIYKRVLKPIFFKGDPEYVHEHMVQLGAALGRHRPTRALTHTLFNYTHPALEQDVLGIHFKNPIGLSAGFDKNAELINIIPSVGFGFEEVGSVTGQKCAGNPGTRLWRLPKSHGLVVYYGLKNDGCDEISRRLSHTRASIPIGVSVATTNCPDNLVLKNAVLDFAKAFRVMEPYGDYLTVNISCPNTGGGQPFVAPHKLDYLFDILDEIPTKKPIFIKLSPDMDRSAVDAVLEMATRHRIHGIICTNLTKHRDNTRIAEDPSDVPDRGGMSGKIVQKLSDDLLAHVYKTAGNRFVLMGCGGVFTAEDAYKKIRLGASLVQMITGMIFEGPQVVSEINRGLVALLARDGYTNISQAIGVDNC